MAHGSPRINICHKCRMYTLVSRFSENPKCPNCNKITNQTTRNDMIITYKLGYLYEFVLNFNSWQKL